MIGPTSPKKPWSIPKEKARLFSFTKINETLGLFNRACGDSFYMNDYFNEKILVGDSAHSTYSGYSRTLVEKEGFDFYNRILKPEEYAWLEKMHRAAYKIFYSYPENQRQNLEISYHLIITTSNGSEIILNYKLVPFLFDENGNMWLGLLFCTQLFATPMGPRATINDFETGKKYEFINDEFVLSETKALTNEEISILKWIAIGMQGKNMCHLLNISERSLERKKQNAFAKLNATTSAAAVYKATTSGII